LNTEAARFSVCEILPAAAVAWGGKPNAPRTVAAPFTFNVVAGFVVPMPTFPVAPVPNWNNREFPSVVLLVQMGM
jgi:hypothetical protein